MKILLTVNDLAKRWQKSERAVRDIVSKHREILKPSKIGGSNRFDPEDVRKFEDNRREISDQAVG